MSEHKNPQNVEAEKAVLGGILLDNESILDLPPELKPESFYLPSHGQIFEAMLALRDKGAPIDIVTIASHRPEISAAAVASLSDWAMPRSIAYHAGLILEAYRQRRALNLVRDSLRELQESPDRYDEIFTKLVLSFSEVDRAQSCPISQVMVEALKRIDKSENDAQLIPTGFTALDEKIGGIELGELLVVGGRPSMGKTSFAVDIGMNAAEKGFNVLIVSIETRRDKLGIRMLSRETKINGRKLRTGNVMADERERLIDASASISGLPIRVQDREPGWQNVKREIQRCKRTGLDLVILDYLTLLNIPTIGNERRDIAVGRIANECKRLALSLNVAFVLLSQLSRKTEDRADPEPTISDLRESGEIEQAADMIIFPFLPVVYDPEFEPRDKAFLKLAKGRDLPKGKIPVRFNAEITSFSDWREF